MSSDGDFSTYTNLVFFLASLVVLYLGEIHAGLSVMAVFVASTIYHMEKDTPNFGWATAHTAAKWDEITAIQACMTVILLFVPRKTPGCITFSREGLQGVINPANHITTIMLAAISWSSSYMFNYHYGNDPDRDDFYLLPGAFALVIVLSTWSVPLLPCFRDHVPVGKTRCPSSIIASGLLLLGVGCIIGLYFAYDHYNQDGWVYALYVTCASVLVGWAAFIWNETPDHSAPCRVDGSHLICALVFAIFATSFYFASHYHNHNLWYHGSWHIAAAIAGVCAVTSRKMAGLTLYENTWPERVNRDD